VHPTNRPADVFGRELTVHWTAEEAPYLELPVIPS
jgi:hypothetical protein